MSVNAFAFIWSFFYFEVSLRRLYLSKNISFKYVGENTLSTSFIKFMNNYLFSNFHDISL